MVSGSLLSSILFLLGVGFLVANVWAFWDFVRYLRLRSSALLTWPGRKPKAYGLLLALGVTFGVLLFVKLVLQRRPPTQVFGETMMFLYYAYAVPLSLRIGRGFYEDGIWAESGFIPYSKIGGLSWREGTELTLVVIYRVRQLARPLVVPTPYYGAVRRLLRDKIAKHDIHFTGKALDIADRDERDVV